ncbi:unnamed protein product [Rotaria sp. Silwood1]|nr:unnamed protein product [Rotaria sp. Silwood1]
MSGSTMNYLHTPCDVELDSSSNVYIADSHNHRVVRWAMSSSSCTVVAGDGTAGSMNNQVSGPYDIAHDWNTNIFYVFDSFNNRILSYPSGVFTDTMVIGRSGTNNIQLLFHTGIYFDISSNSLYIANSSANNIVRWVVGVSN